MHGWVKLMGDKVLARFAKEHDFRAVSRRFINSYVFSANKYHAVSTIITSAFVMQRQFGVWGTRDQLHYWADLSDIAESTLTVAEHALDGQALKITAVKETCLPDAAITELDHVDNPATAVTRPNMPTGPCYRIAGICGLAECCGLRPEIALSGRLARTMDSCEVSNSRVDGESRLPGLLSER
jgi:nucleoside-diphosphate-sugar epimerase